MYDVGFEGLHNSKNIRTHGPVVPQFAIPVFAIVGIVGGVCIGIVIPVKPPEEK